MEEKLLQGQFRGIWKDKTEAAARICAPAYFPHDNDDDQDDDDDDDDHDDDHDDVMMMWCWCDDDVMKKIRCVMLKSTNIEKGNVMKGDF